MTHRNGSAFFGDKAFRLIPYARLPQVDIPSGPMVLLVDKDIRCRCFR